VARLGILERLICWTLDDCKLNTNVGTLGGCSDFCLVVLYMLQPEA
jgi:hypothetical protein